MLINLNLFLKDLLIQIFENLDLLTYRISSCIIGQISFGII